MRPTRRVADDVVAREVGEVDVLDAAQHPRHQAQPGRTLRQVDLRDVAGHDHARAEARAG